MPSPRTFLITGASTGIGAATARHAVAAGHRVVLAARSEEKLTALVDELGGEEHALAVRTDVTEWEEVEALATRAVDAFDSIDVVFANAGFGGARSFSPETADPVEDWKSMILTNVYGVALTIRATIDHLRASQGHLLITSSVAGRRSLPGSLYSATKFAATAMGESVRQELNGSGCRVTVVEPGMVDTPFFENKPQLRALEGDDIARAVMYAVEQPAHVDVNELLIRPTAQDG